jgi:hypothetical protein
MADERKRYLLQRAHLFSPDAPLIVDLKQLADDGLIAMTDNGIELTSKGREELELL